MIGVDCSALLKKLEEVKKEYNSLEENQINLFANLNSICNVDWIDANSVALDKVFNSDKLETQKFRINISSKMSILDYVHSQYSSFCSKLSCNLNKKTAVFSAIDNCLNVLSAIDYEFRQVDFSFYYPERFKIRNHWTTCIDMKTKLSEIRNDIENIYSKIEGIEGSIKEKIKEIEDFKVEPYTYAIGNNEILDMSARLDEALFELDGQKVEFYKIEEEKKLREIYNGMDSITDVYTSSNTSLYKTSLVNYNNCINDIVAKRKSYISTLKQVPDLYLLATATAKNKLEGDNNG